MSPNKPKNVTVAGFEATPVNIRPGRKRGEASTLALVFNDISSVAYYRFVKRFEEFAGEADFGQLLGGKPFVREHPLEQWPVDSHIVPVVYGDEVAEDRSFWGVIVAVDDASTFIADTVKGDSSYGTKPYSIEPYGEAFEPSDNHYRLNLDVVKLAPLEDYADRSELLADLSPSVNQL